MTTCQHCHRRSELYLCDSCQIDLCNRLDQIPWLLKELDNRIQKLDRLSVGTIGRNRRPDTLDAIDFDAIEVARTIRKTLLHWVETIATRATGRPPTALNTASTADLARWLSANITHIARINLNHRGRHQLYDDITHIAGTPEQAGQLHHAINPTEHHLVGPCPTPIGRNHDGTPRECGRTLYADTYDKTTTCPDCHHTIDVETNRLRAAGQRDLHTRTNLIDVLATIDEPVEPTRVDQWINARRLRPGGYQHDQTIIEFKIHPNDEPVYSLDRARKLRRRDNGLTRRRTRSHHF